ncbi:MAG: hypothetical protein DHS20C13_03370 [Thermodesulfobacteriota bacterium]|nr:MAG: hypothetical protein DHS20C13_03370 [Thermodesulfobacteriota bacterium]
MRINSKLLLILPLLLVLALAACDSSTNSNAQDTDTDSACPCFSAQDIMNEAMGKDFFGCTVIPSGFSVSLDLSEGETEFTIAVSCESGSFSSCQCVDGVSGVASSVTEEQYFDCTNIVVEAITTEFEQESMGMCLIAN